MTKYTENKDFKEGFDHCFNQIEAMIFGMIARRNMRGAYDELSVLKKDMETMLEIQKRKF